MMWILKYLGLSAFVWVIISFGFGAFVGWSWPWDWKPNSLEFARYIFITMAPTMWVALSVSDALGWRAEK